MEKIIVFFCDLYGTYITNNSKTNEEITKEFIYKINEISNKYNIDKIIFSFITTEDDYNILLSALEEFNKHVNGKIILGEQFYNGGYLSSNLEVNNNLDKNIKAKKINDYLKKLYEKCEIELVIYADDCIFNHEMIDEFMEHNVPIMQIIPGLNEENNYISSTKSNLNGVNECLDKILVK